MSITEGQSRYSIAALLDTAIQPFKPMPDDELTALAKAIGKNKPLADPVSMTGDGSNIVIDGSQRLRAMLRAGQKSSTPEISGTLKARPGRMPLSGLSG